MGFASGKDGSDAEEDCNPPAFAVPLDRYEVHVARVLDVGMVPVVDDRIYAFGRGLEWPQWTRATIDTLTVTSLRPSLGSEEVVHIVLLQDVTTFRYAQGGSFGKNRGSQGPSGSQLDLVDEGLDLWIAVGRWLVEVESRDRLIHTSIIVEEKLKNEHSCCQRGTRYGSHLGQSRLRQSRWHRSTSCRP